MLTRVFRLFGVGPLVAIDGDTANPVRRAEVTFSLLDLGVGVFITNCTVLIHPVPGVTVTIAKGPTYVPSLLAAGPWAGQ